MNKTTTRRSALQSISREPFTMVPDSVDNFKVSRAAKDTLRLLTRLCRFLGGQCDWPERKIAAHLKMRRGTYRDHRRQLERAGLIELVRRRLRGCRQNLANILRIVVGGSKIQPQKRREILKTNTPAPSRGVISKLREFWERRFSQDRKDSAWRRAEYEHRAKVWEEAKRQRAERSGCNLFNPVSIVSPDSEADRAWIVDWRKRNGLEER